MRSGDQKVSEPGAQALGIAERFRVFFRRPYPTSEEGVERAVQQLAQEIENAIRRAGGNEKPAADEPGGLSRRLTGRDSL